MCMYSCSGHTPQAGTGVCLQVTALPSAFLTLHNTRTYGPTGLATKTRCAAGGLKQFGSQAGASLHPEGPATGQRHRALLRFSRL
jgi:hypothetical protein